VLIPKMARRKVPKKKTHPLIVFWSYVAGVVLTAAMLIFLHLV
jgi:hypothetical protein